jgi:undecaprenyl-diphosphatase
MLAYLLLTLSPRRWLRYAAVTGLALLILTIGFSRMYLSAHWFTDVLGGFTLGAAWAAFWIAFLECGRRRSRRARRMQEAHLNQTSGGSP